MSKTSLVQRFAERYFVEPTKLLETLKHTAFKQRDNQPITNEQLMSLLIVADQYKLNPFTKEIYAFPDQNGGIVPVVGVDGWNRIINENPHMDGIEFEYSDDIDKPQAGKPCPSWCDCIIYRSDRSRPVKAREYLDEVYRPPFYSKRAQRDIPGPWQTHTKRMLRHKAEIQTARIAFGFAGIYDEDEAQRIIEQEEKEIQAEVVPRETTMQEAQLALPELPVETFEQEYSNWKKFVSDGAIDPAGIVEMLETNYSLSDEQKTEIHKLAGVED